MDKIKVAFNDFMQDMYDEEELQYMDSGFVGALEVAFNQSWQAAIASAVVDIESLPSASYTDDGVVYRSHVEDALEKAGIKCK